MHIPLHGQSILSRVLSIFFGIIEQLFANADHIANIVLR